MDIRLLKVCEFKNKMRCGALHDGGYVIADLEEANYDCYISAGVSYEESFSRDFINRYQMRKEDCYAFDGTIEDYPYHYTENIHFFKKNIDVVNDDNHSDLSFLMEKYNNIFLKMDIEGGEYKWLLHIDHAQLDKFKQMVIEFHGINDDNYGYILDEKKICIEKILKTHYIVHAHGNNYDTAINGIPNVIELTFVNKRYFRPVIPFLNKIPLPIPNLDFRNNPQTPELDLNFFPFVS